MDTTAFLTVFIVTQSDNFGSDGLDDYDNYSFLKGTLPNTSSKRGFGNKASTSNLSNINDGKNGWGIAMDTSAIEVNQSQDYDEFDDVLNTLDKGFKQREGKKKKNAFRSVGHYDPI